MGNHDALTISTASVSGLWRFFAENDISGRTFEGWQSSLVPWGKNKKMISLIQMYAASRRFFKKKNYFCIIELDRGIELDYISLCVEGPIVKDEAYWKSEVD